MKKKYAKWHSKVLKVASFLDGAAVFGKKSDESDEGRAYWAGVTDAMEVLVNMVDVDKNRERSAANRVMPKILERLRVLEERAEEKYGRGKQRLLELD